MSAEAIQTTPPFEEFRPLDGFASPDVYRGPIDIGALVTNFEVTPLADMAGGLELDIKSDVTSLQSIEANDTKNCDTDKHCPTAQLSADCGTCPCETVSTCPEK